MSRMTSASESGTATESRRLKSTSSGFTISAGGMPRALLHDLRMHRAGVDGVLGKRLGLAALIEIAVGLFGKFDAAAFGAKVIGVAVMIVGGLGGGGIHRHPANGGDRHSCFCAVHGARPWRRLTALRH